MKNPLDGEAFAESTFADLQLPGGSLAGKDFRACHFRRCKLEAVDWSEARLEDCTFDGCDLSRVNLKKTLLRGVRFKECRLMGVDWSLVGSLPDVAFEQCDLRYGSFVKLKLRKTRFVGCVAREAAFLETDLTESDFTDTELTATNFEGCVLAKADFRKARGLFLNPRTNQVRGARIGLETAVALVQSFGLVVDGFEDPA